MKISELSRVSDTPIPTIKFYIRKGLLPPGKTSSPNQASYGEVHLERLDLIFRLKTFADLSIDKIAEVLGASDAKANRYAALEAGVNAAVGEEGAPEPVLDSPGQQFVRALAAKRNWPLGPNDPALLAVAQAFDKAGAGWPFEVREERIEQYVDVIEQLVELEISDDWSEGMSQDGMLKFAVLGTFLFEPLILALRQAAHRVRVVETLSRNRRPQPAVAKRESGA